MVIKYIMVAFLITLALFSDIREYKIRNRLTGFFLLAGLCVNFYLASLEGLRDSVLGVVILFPLLLLYGMRFLGAGDVKLMFAIGAIVGWRLSVYCALYSFVTGGVIAALLLLRRKNARERFSALLSHLKAMLYTRSFIPYTARNDGVFRFGYAIFTGCIMALALDILR